MLIRLKISMVLVAFFGYSAIAQTKCTPKSLYKTNFINNGKDSSRLSLPLFFVVRPDSVIVSFDPNGKNEFLSFRILSKECFWEDDFLEGKSIFKLMLGDAIKSRYATLIIEENKRKGTYIELLYENAEKRVFSKL